MSADPVSSVPLWLLYDDEVDAWRGAQSPPVETWLNEHGFKGERHRVVLVPDAGGALAIGEAIIARDPERAAEAAAAHIRATAATLEVIRDEQTRVARALRRMGRAEFLSK